MIYVNTYPIVSKVFSDGCVDVQLTEDIVNSLLETNTITINASLKNSNDFMSLLLLVGILKEKYARIVLDTLYVFYLPYARSDRTMVEHYSSGALKTISECINTLGFKEIIVYDTHSDVSEALIKNIKIVKQHNCVKTIFMHYSLTNKVDFLIAPDAGASKKVEASSELLSIPFLQAFKKRDLNTNQIIKTVLQVDDPSILKGKTIMILDDIAEYGTTHRNLAQVLKEDYKVDKVYLYITHGIFPLNKRLEKPSRFDFILEYVDNIYCRFLWESKDTSENFKVNFIETY